MWATKNPAEAGVLSDKKSIKSFFVLLNFFSRNITKSRSDFVNLFNDLLARFFDVHSAVIISTMKATVPDTNRICRTPFVQQIVSRLQKVALHGLQKVKIGGKLVPVHGGKGFGLGLWGVVPR